MFIDEDLENTRMDNENPDYALWVEEDYCLFSTIGYGKRKCA
jgi:hypothetical protein